MNTLEILEALASGAIGLVLVTGIGVHIALNRLRRLVPSEHENLPGGRRG